MMGWAVNNLAIGIDMTIPDYSHINICAKCDSPKVGCCHKYAASAHKWVVDQVSLLDLRAASAYHKVLVLMKLL